MHFQFYNIIGQKIHKIDLEKNKKLLREYTKDKLGILDLIATLDDGVICHIEMHIIELPKIRKMKKQEEKNTLTEWMMFFDNTNDREVLEIMKTNKEIEEAMKKLEEIQSDEEMMRIIDLRKKSNMGP